MHALRTIGLLLAAVAGSAVYWKLGYTRGLPLLVLVVSLAVVGKGNRLLWLAVFPLLSCVVAALAYLLFGLLPETPELPRLLALFTLVTLVPAAVIWSAVKFKSVCARSNTKVPSEA
jgi:predicted neutral ceramidase superfamily lipid hydrolase